MPGLNIARQNRALARKAYCRRVSENLMLQKQLTTRLQEIPGALFVTFAGLRKLPGVLFTAFVGVRKLPRVLFSAFVLLRKLH